VARDRAAFEECYTFEGNYTNAAGAATAAFRWGTRFVKTATGLIHGRAELAEVESGLPETIGGPPERLSSNIIVSNHDGELDQVLIGTPSPNASAEYFEDSVLNLKGRINHLVKDPVSGALFSQPISPTLFCSGPPRYKNFRVNIPLATRDDEFMGASKNACTNNAVKHCRRKHPVTGVDLGPLEAMRRDGFPVTFFPAAPPTDEVVDQDSYESILLSGWDKSLDARAGFPYGKCPIPLTSMHTGKGFNDVSFFVGLFKREPHIDNFYDQGWQFRSGRWASEEGNALWAPDPFYFSRFRLVRMFRWVLCEDNEWRAFWCLFVTVRATSSGAEIYERETQYMIPGVSTWGVNDDATTAGAALTSGPVNIIKEIISQHSELGAVAIDAASFAAAHANLRAPGVCGGIYYCDARISEVVAHIAQNFGLSVWVDGDSKVKILANGVWSSIDAANAATALPHLQYVDILSDWDESIPRDPEARGSACTRLTIEYTDQQREFWGDNLIDRVTVGALLPLGGIREMRVSGAWLFGEASAAALGMTQTAASHAFVTRRFVCVTHSWVGTYPLGSLFRISTPHGLGPQGAGYAQRLCRLERVVFLPNDHGVRATFEDLGPLAGSQPWKLDSIDNWDGYNPDGGGVSVTLVAGSNLATFSAGIVPAGPPGWLNMNLWTFGAANAANRRSRNITARISATQVQVEFPYSVNETIPASAGATKFRQNWRVAKTQQSEGSAYRPDYGRLCAEGTGVFRDGIAKGYQLMG
jgi:hypothetical protein